MPETRDIFGDMTVEENLRVAFGDLNGGRQARVAEFARIHALFPILQDRTPQLAGNLSGGQQQRCWPSLAPCSDDPACWCWTSRRRASPAS